MWMGATGITSDSEFKAALSSAELFRQLLESAPDAIVGIGRDGRIVLVNAQTEKLFGYARDELIGEPVEKLVPARYHGSHGAHRSGYFHDPRTRPMGAGLDLYGLRSDGSEFPAEISLSSIQTEDGLLATAAIRDITDRKNAERDLARHAAELQRSNIELSQYAYVASHDLQEPLRMVVAYTDRLSEHLAGSLGPREQEWAGYVVEGATRMQSLIEGLLEFDSRRRRRADHARRPADDLCRPPAAAAALPEPRRQRPEVPRRRAAADPHRLRARGR